MSNEHNEIAKIVQALESVLKSSQTVDSYNSIKAACKQAGLTIDGHGNCTWSEAVLAALERGQEGQDAIAELELREANVVEDIEELTAKLAIAESRVTEDQSALEFAREGRDKAQAALLSLGWDYSIDSAEWAANRKIVKLRSEELAMLEYLERRREPVTRWTLHDVVDPKHRVRNREAADFGILLLQRLGMVTVKTSDLAINDLISLVPNEKVDP